MNNDCMDAEGRATQDAKAENIILGVGWRRVSTR